MKRLNFRRGCGLSMRLLIASAVMLTHAACDTPEAPLAAAERQSIAAPNAPATQLATPAQSEQPELHPGAKRPARPQPAHPPVRRSGEPDLANANNTACPDPALDDGLDCTDLVCVDGATVNVPKAGFCVIGNVCWNEGDRIPGDGCGYCDTSYSQEQMNKVLYEEDFNDGDASDWTLTDETGAGIVPNVDNQRAASPAYSLYFGDPATHTYSGSGNDAVYPMAKSPSITIDAGVLTQLEFKLWEHTESGTNNKKDEFYFGVERSDGTIDLIWHSAETEWDQVPVIWGNTEDNWYVMRFTLEAYTGQTIRLVFWFDTQDKLKNNQEGAYIDDIELSTICCVTAAHCDDGSSCSDDHCAGNICFHPRAADADPSCPDCDFVPPNIVLVVDRGSSGNATNALGAGQFEEMIWAIYTVTGGFGGVINLAIKTFPDPNDNGCVVNMDTAEAPFDADVDAFIWDLVSWGVSASKPADLGLLAAKNLFENAGLTERNYVILLTRGQYNCNADPLAAVKDLAEAGIKTFVIVLNDNEDVDLHNDMAASGGMPKEPNFPGDVFYYRADSLHQTFYALWESYINALTDYCEPGDHNCDGVEVDNRLEKELCLSWCGEWVEGDRWCLEDGWSACIGPGINAIDVCNGQDDDCDGEIDEDFAPEPCLPWCTTCTGLTTCIDGVPGCEIDTCPADDQCDDIDNECDGITDPLFPVGQACDSDDADFCPYGVYACNATQDGVDCINDPPQFEICDGVNDEDCDGTVDEEDADGCTDYYYDGDRDTWGAGDPRCLCQPDGFWDTEKIWDCDDNDDTVYPGAPEICDNKDNDCNGITDWIWDGCYTGPEGTENVGICHDGLEVCLFGTWLGCFWEQLPEPEVCDNLDNNCDTTTDEDLQRACYSGPAETRYVGTCEDGLEDCSAGVWGPECVDDVTPVVETCDNLDNDCDGVVDQNIDICYSGPDETRGVGTCADGWMLCTAGDWGACQDDVIPQDEVCDGLDNDCDGLTDEHPDDASVLMTRACYTGPTATRMVGECKDGIQTCIDGDWEDACPGEVLPAVEVCDTLDNDCDGITDQNTQTCYEGPDGTLDVGICKAGWQLCTIGVWGECFEDVLPETEVCDTLDNDCDGLMNEDPVDPARLLWQDCYTGPAETVGVGLCVEGYEECHMGNWGPDCIDEVTPATEECDGFDQDCDDIHDGDELSTGDDPCDLEADCQFGMCYCIDPAGSSNWKCTLE